MEGAHSPELAYPVIRAPGRESAGRARIGLACVRVSYLGRKELDDPFGGLCVRSKKSRQPPDSFSYCP